MLAAATLDNIDWFIGLPLTVILVVMALVRRQRSRSNSEPSSVVARPASVASGRQTATKLFLSYRPDNSLDVTDRIYDRLCDAFGRAHVFTDVDSAKRGLDVRKSVRSVVDRCDVFVAVVDDRWLTATGPGGARRLFEPADLVRIEIERALQRTIPIIPVLVRGATVPSEKELPASIAAISYRHGIPVRSDPDFHSDVDRLINGIRAYAT
jgi:hypothetical protein